MTQQTVEVRPIDRSTWHGKTGKENFARPKVYEVLYDVETGRYATGLTEEDEEKYSKILGVELGNQFAEGQPHPYWSSKPAFIVLPNHTKIFNLNKASDYIKVKNMKASKYVANSLKEYEEGKWPFATHVIFDESEEVAIKAVGAKLRKDVYKLSDQMDKDSKIAMILLVKNKNLKGRTDNFIDVAIDEIADNKDDAALFINLAREGREQVEIRAKVTELLDRNILTKEGSAIFYMGEQIGYDFEKAVEWFKDPNNQKIKLTIIDKLNK